jgi:hypothetical protein
MADDAGAPRRRWLRGRGVGAWSAGLAEAICERVAAGELLYAVCREAGMPTAQSVGRWARERPAFGAALAAARLAGGRPGRGGGGVWTYDLEVAEAICQRIAEGEALTAICEAVEMPCFSTVYNWGRRFPEFAQMMRDAREAQAAFYCDRGWALAMAATPQTAYLTDVRLKQLRWMAGCLAPRVYGAKRVEPEAAREVLTTLVRTFIAEVDPVTGKEKVVSLCPNPVTGEVERTDVPGWQPTPADAVVIPAG